MNFRWVCLIGIVASAPFGLGFVLFPEAVSSLYGITGWSASTLLVGRLYGMALLFIAGASFAAQDTQDTTVQRRLCQSNTVCSIIGAVLCLQSVTGGSTNALMWSVVLLFAALAVMFWSARPKA